MSGKKKNLITDKKLGYVKSMCKHDFRSRGTRGKNEQMVKKKNGYEKIYVKIGL